MHNIAVLNDIFLAFKAHFPGGAMLLFMVSLIVAEVGGFLVLFAGFVAGYSEAP